MADHKSLDELELIIALLCDVQMSHSLVFTPRALRLTTAMLRKRYAREGISLLTKTLPRLGKALDRALSSEDPLDVGRWRKLPSTQLPRFLGELFQLIFNQDGRVLPNPDVEVVRTLRQVLTCFYKYELPYAPSQEEEVLNSFIQNEEELDIYHRCSAASSDNCPNKDACSRFWCPTRATSIGVDSACIIERARKLLSNLFEHFDWRDIRPKHGPGSVSTGERLAGKYQWSTISPRLIECYPLDAYFYASLGEVCDKYDELQALRLEESYAKVVLVPKDSRGPRLISEEPLDFQWIQQGLLHALISHVEHHPLTRWNVRFTDQTPNRIAALSGSVPYRLGYRNGRRDCKVPLLDGRYATLDLKDASDRISQGLVRQIWPPELQEVLFAARSLGTTLPSGEVKMLNKFAPMGSAICFPVLALTIWALLSAGLSDNEARECLYVYGDDVIVRGQDALYAMKLLEVFGLKVNRAKSCTKGFFRESCGLDAFRGEDVTPVRFKTVWASTRRPDVYESWIQYANALIGHPEPSIPNRRQYRHAYDYIVSCLCKVYKEIPSIDMGLPCPALVEVPESHRPKVSRTNPFLQRKEWRVWDIKPKKVQVEIDGWSMLRRYFAEMGSGSVGFRNLPSKQMQTKNLFGDLGCREAFSVRSYTPRDTSILVKRWR